MEKEQSSYTALSNNDAFPSLRSKSLWRTPFIRVIKAGCETVQ